MNNNDEKDIAMKEYDEEEEAEKDLGEVEEGKGNEKDEEEEEKNQFPNAWDPNPMIKISKLFFIIPSAFCSTLYLAILICALIIPSPTWYTVTMQIMVVPCYLFAFVGGLSGILGAALLPKNQFVCRMMLKFYRLSQYFAQTITAFLSEFVGMCIAFESASGSMNGRYFDFERKRIEYMNQFHNAFFPEDAAFCIKVSAGLYIAITVMLVVSNLANSCLGVTRFSNVVIGDKMNSRIYGYVALFRILFMCIVELNAVDGYPPWGMFGFGKLRIMWGIIFAVLAVVVLVALVIYIVYFHYLWYREHPFSLAELQAEEEAIPLAPVIPPVAPVSDISQDPSTNKDPNTNADPSDDGDKPRSATPNNQPNNGNTTPTGADTESKHSLNSSTHEPPHNQDGENITHPRPNSAQRLKEGAAAAEAKAETAADTKTEAAAMTGTTGADGEAAAGPPQTTESGMPIFYCPDGVTPLPAEAPLLFTEKQHNTLRYMRYFLTISLLVTLIVSIVMWVFSLYYFIVLGVISIMHDNTATYHIPMMDASKGDNINYYNLYVSENLDGDPETDNVVSVYRIADFIQSVSLEGLTTAAVMAIFFYGFGMISSGMFWWCFVFSVTRENNSIIRSFENSFQKIDVRLIEDAKLKKEAWIKKEEERAAKKANAAREKEEKKAAKAERRAARKAAKAEKKAAEAGAATNADGSGSSGEKRDEDTGLNQATGATPIRIGTCDDETVDSKMRAALSGLTIIAANDNVHDRRTGSGGGGVRVGKEKIHMLEDENEDDPVTVGVLGAPHTDPTVLEDYNGNLPVFDLK